MKLCHKYNPKGRWERFRGQELKTGDVLLTKSGSLACVDSGYTTGEPSRITSIPENWSWSFENGAINDRKRSKEYDSGYISKSGRVYREKRYGGGCGLVIEFFYRLSTKK